MIEIVVTNREIEKASMFASESLKTHSYFSNRGQSNSTKIRQQIFTGKIGEFAARKWLINCGHTCSYVDTTVTLRKSFSTDLTVDSIVPCHVKSQDKNSAEMYGLSWTFQYSGKGGVGHTDHEIFANYGEKDKVIFCLVNIPLVYLCAEIRVADLHRLNLFDLPKLKHLQETKRVVYYERIPEEYTL